MKVTPEMRAAVLREMVDEVRAKGTKPNAQPSDNEIYLDRLATEAESRVNFLAEKTKAGVA